MTPILIQPMHNRVLVKRADPKHTTTSGLIIPESAKEKPHMGVVIAAGPGQYHKGVRLALAVKPGDAILFGKYSGQDFEYGGEMYLFLTEQEILGVFEEGEQNV